MTGSAISTERVGRHIDLVLIDRAPVNALAPADWQSLRSAIAASGDDMSVRAVVLAGMDDGSFCAGADVRRLNDDADTAEETSALRIVAETATTIRDLRVPVVAAISGAAHGGGLELALACDIRIADDSATFAAAGVNMGLIASVGSLMAAVGDGRARAMLLTGDRIDAQKAMSWGLVTEVTGEDSSRSVALAVAESIALKAPLAVEATKRAAAEFHRRSHEEHAALVDRLFSELAATADHREAMKAFLEKRPGTYTRR